MIDIHCHILPYLDDGARNIEEAVEMAKIAYDEGITKIVATPHYIANDMYSSLYEICQRIKEFQIALESEDIKIEVLPGSEVYLTYNLPLLIKDEDIITINNTQYLLIELPMFHQPSYTGDVIFNLKLMGIIPIIAHPERYRYVKENPNVLTKYINMGALCQINSGSLTGEFGKDVFKTSKTLISHNMAHVVASDGHSLRTRAPRLKMAYERVTSLYGEEKSEELFIINPQKIIDDEEIDGVKPNRIIERSKIKRFFISRTL